MSMQYKGSTRTRSVSYIPQVNLNKVTTLLGASSPTDIGSDYYYIYNYQDWIDMVNAAFTQLWTDTQSMMATLGGYIAGTKAPFIEFDPSTCKCSLTAELNTFDNGLTDPVYIYFNSRLFELFGGFQNTFMGYDGDLNYQMSVVNTGGNISYVFNKTGGYTTNLVMYQEISTVSLWNPVASIVFCSSMLPIYPTQTSKPNIISNQSNNLTSSGENANLTNILSDFEIPVSDTNQYRPIILYAPSAEYRLVDMFSGSNLNKINISVFWKTHYGELIPFKIDPGCAAHMKILFRRKDFYIA